MGLGLDVIEYQDPTNRLVVKRVPESGAGDVPYGAQLIVHGGDYLSLLEMLKKHAAELDAIYGADP